MFTIENILFGDKERMHFFICSSEVKHEISWQSEMSCSNTDKDII